MTYIDLYCERVTPGLGSEPINIISNLAFFVAAIALFKLIADRNSPLSLWVLISLIVAIGAGSTLFHTFATKWSQLLDVIPILLFQIGYLWLYLGRVVKLKKHWSLCLVSLFFLASSVSQQWANWFNGSLSYLPGLCFLAGLAIYHYQQQKREKFILLLGTGVFTVALFFRTIDHFICPYFSIGTHFLWHFFNGFLVYLLGRSLIVNERGVGV